ncbi:MAG TPA: DUF4038 domain-containing protein, partial [Chitinophagaceae bacterium]|nr:DUF4038 domain-containing protein [Chitinophagaceae bacterium]
MRILLLAFVVMFLPGLGFAQVDSGSGYVQVDHGKGYAQIDHGRGFAQVDHGRIRVSDDKFYLQYEDGTPFFWLGDTGWELFHRLTNEEISQYLE